MNKQWIKFLNTVYRYGNRKEKLYDGMNSKMTVDQALRCATEELGEVASAISRERFPSALDECIDLAHAIFLIWQAILRENKVER